jgi:signal peptidase I
MNDVKGVRSAPVAPAPTAPPAVPRTQPTKRPPSSNRREGLRSILSTVAVLLIAPLIALFLTAFIFQSYQVDGPSMETTLQDRDRLIVYKLSRTWAKITGNDYIPKRGDVVVFHEPHLAQFGQDPSKQLIKRVLGLPGDRVVVKERVLTVYNKEHPNGFRPDETLPYGNVIGTTPIEGEWKVGKGQLFVVGDNRTNSLDSRTFGPIDANDVVGKLVARVLPVDKMKRF